MDLKSIGLTIKIIGLFAITLCFGFKPTNFDALKIVTTEQNIQYQTNKNYDYFAFCYHDVVTGLRGDLNKDPGALNVEHLIQHFKWLKDNGYTVVSLQQIDDAKKGLRALPEKAVLLTFDDGYRSFYTQIFPLLKRYQYPAVFALVTDWIENEKPVKYGKAYKTADDFLTWEQVKEIHDSGLVEIASHTNDLHHGVLANPYQNELPAVTTRTYTVNGYEAVPDYESRVKADLARSYNILKSKLGVAPKTIVWPYGSHSNVAWELAKSIGFKHSLVLEQGQNYLSDNSEHINRFLVSDNITGKQFANALKPYSFKTPERLVHVDLDYVYDPNPEQQEKNLSALLDRIFELQITTVYLQAFADPDGDGNADSLYFPNNHLPVKSDLFSRVAWQLKTRANVKVYAWMPVTAFELGNDFYQKNGVKSFKSGAVKNSDNNYKRLSVFSDAARTAIFDIYNSLGSHAHFAGVLYHDDAFLTDYEDVSEAALNYYRTHGLTFNQYQELRQKPLLDKWSKLKTKALIDFTNELTDVLKHYHPQLKTARNIYALPIINPQSEEWFAQNLIDFANAYDYVAIMAMPYMENAKDPEQWLKNLMKELAKVSEQYPIRDKLIFELQAKDWRSGKAVDSEILKQQMQYLQMNGFINFGYYPDDFIKDYPKLEIIKPAISIQSSPIGVEG